VSKELGGSPAESAKLAVVIMAAGKGTRLKSRRPKVLHEIGGKPLLVTSSPPPVTLWPWTIFMLWSATRQSA